MEQSLKGKTILITGGTSTLGQAFVHKAVGEGAIVCFTYHQNEAILPALEGPGIEAFKLDLSDMRAIDEFAKDYKARIGKLDVLIHNAAAVRDHTLKNMTEEEWDYVMTVDLKAPYYLTKKLFPLLMKKTRSPKKVFMLTSRVAVQGGVGVSNYAAAKAGLIGLTKSLAQEMGKRKILVNAVNPGFMKSAMTKDLPEEVIERNLEVNPLGDFSNHEEIAEFLIYLSSDAMSQVTGQVLHFEGRKI